MTPFQHGGLAATLAPVKARSTPELDSVIRRGADYLLARQAHEGYWVGELEADRTLESDYILLQLWLYPPDSAGEWNPPSADRVQRAALRILDGQTGDGGWSLYPGGPANVSASVKAYCALRLAGFDSDDPLLQKARRCILSLGGVEAANSYTKIYLSYFGLYPRAKTPTIPPEFFLLPETAHFNIYEMSSWSRAILAPLAIVGARQTSRSAPAGLRLEEICSGVEPPRPAFFSWRNFFLRVDWALKLWERTDFRPARQKAVDAAAQWMLRHLEASDGLGAIFPGQLNSIMALSELGYGLDHPIMRREIEYLEKLVVDDGETLRLQPCLSPVWDTALTCYALGSALAGQDPKVHAALEQAADWLLSKEVRHYGDWAVKNTKAEPGGWYFEFANEFYPDTDDTAKVLLAMEFARGGDANAQQQAESRAVDWLLSMQSSDGGWAAFDVDNNSQFLTHVPFADHNAMLDPTCADITGRVLEAICRRGPGKRHPAVRRGVEYLRKQQEEDGSWYGRWGVNYIYGTCFALRGLEAAGEDPREAYIIRAGEWLRSIQNADGGWGESCSSYDDPADKIEGGSTPTQTAWALLGLFATGDYETGSVRDGIRYLLESQNGDGSWSEDLFTGTGFPRVFYLKYQLYPQYFPLMALAKYQTFLRENSKATRTRNGRAHRTRRTHPSAHLNGGAASRGRTPNAAAAMQPVRGRD
jgi:squalene-hopene/tetraprenyl-beta-curcumene cyclase